MISFDVGTALDIVLAGAGIAMIVTAVYVVVRTRHAKAVRLFGAVVDRPRLWAAAAVCIGLHTLLGVGNLNEILPVSWEDPARDIQFALLLPGLVMLSFASFSRPRAKRRRESEPPPGP